MGSFAPAFVYHPFLPFLVRDLTGRGAISVERSRGIVVIALEYFQSILQPNRNIVHSSLVAIEDCRQDSVPRVGVRQVEHKPSSKMEPAPRPFCSML
jgi:hypothetical protein